MPVRLIKPYLGQAANTLYWDTAVNEGVLRATNTADDALSQATDYRDGSTRIVTIAAANVSRNAKTYDMVSATAQTLTVPQSAYFPVGTMLTVNQLGTAPTTILPAVGVTLTATPGTPSLVTNGTGSIATLVKIDVDSWLVSVSAPQTQWQSNFLSNNWYCPVVGATLSGGGPLAIGVMYLTCFYISSPVTIKSLGVRVTTVSAGGNVAAGIYANNPATNQPTGVALASVNGLGTTVATTVSAALGTPATLSPAIYWMATTCDNSAAALQILALATSVQGGIVGDSSLSNVSSTATAGSLWLQTSVTYPSFPNLTAASFSSQIIARAAIVFFQVN